MSQVHINVECLAYPFDWKNGAWSVAPGQYTFGNNYDMATDVTVNFTNKDGLPITEDLYIIAHAVVCTIPIEGWEAEENIINPVTHTGYDCGDVEKSADNLNTTIESNNLKVYPNPFKDQVRFEFVSPASVNAQLDIYDMLGRKVHTVFEGPVEAGVTYTRFFRPETMVSGMYYYKMKMGEALFNGKLIYNK